jgi:hypothetical protein
VLSTHWSAKPVLVTEFGKMYVKDGLFLVPFNSWEQRCLLVMAPGQALSGAHQALRALSANIAELARERVAGH